MTRNKRVTIATVAERAKCSVATVSLVLNGKAIEHGINGNTAQRVAQAAAELHYVPNETARSLQRRKSGVIGVIFLHLRNDFAENIMRGINNVLRNEKYIPFITSHGEDARVERSEIHKLLTRQVEAIICEPLLDDKSYKHILSSRVPLVVLGSSLDAIPKASYVTWDTFSAARASVQHLVNTGRRRIGFLSEVDPRTTFTDRHKGYVQGMYDAGLDMVPEHVGWVSAEHSLSSVITQMFENRAKAPDGILAATDDLAIKTMGNIEAMGLRVPEDVALVGMGGGPLCSHPRISLTTACAPMEEMGQQSAAIALGLARNPDTKASHRVIVYNHIAVRRSTAGPVPDESNNETRTPS